MKDAIWFRPLVAALLAGCSATLNAGDVSDRASGLEFFEKKIRPLLVENCYNCHSANTNAKGGLRVDDRNGLIDGGNRGPAVAPGEPEKSLLLRAVEHRGNLKMPPGKQLSDEQIADLRTWIEQGAAWPADELDDSVGELNAEYERLRKEHWAWQPLRDAKPPEVNDAAWVRSDVDRFVLAKLTEKGLAPVADADCRNLVRRVTFDLTGLPPSPEDVERFVADGSADAYEKLVDRLLASPAYGERWGRHWLDVARYGESTGSSRNIPLPHAWRYRDYVIDSFNADKPYDRFIREQIAGDLLPAESSAEKDELLIATGFLAIGVKDVNQRFKVRFIMDNIDEQIDTVSRSVLALSASCARCHDHKFDPIPTADYYALAGIFQSSDLCAGVRNKMGGGGLDYYNPEMLLRLSTSEPAAPTGQIEQAKAAYEQAKAEWEAIRGTPKGLARAADGRPTQRPYRLKMERLRAEYLALTDPGSRGHATYGMRESKTIADTPIRIRGEAEKHGPVVPRGFLSVVQFPDQPKIDSTHSGRLELAQWLTSNQNPLTPRVMANRIWQHLFGQGIVRSVDNFGTTGDVPSHPELLDYLAKRLIDEGWSVKKLVRMLVLSRTYQLSADATADRLTVDPENRLLWRHAPRRLDAEEIRDATLAAAGTLDVSRPAGSSAKELRVVELQNIGPLAKKLAESARASNHRSVYLPLVRGQTPTSLEVFDFAEQGTTTGSRSLTTVPPQSLYLLNDPFVRRQSIALAERLLKNAAEDSATQIQHAYQLILGRAATDTEVERVKSFLAGFEQRVALSIAVNKPASTEIAAATPGNAAENDAEPEVKPGNAADPPINPDEIVYIDEPPPEEKVAAADAKTAAWASFCQALLGSAEFRYLK